MCGCLYNPPQGGGGGSGGALGKFIAAALSAGANNNVNPGSGWPAGYGRLDLNTAAGVANVTGLVAANTDGQMVLLRNSGANNVTLNVLSAGSAAANQFLYAYDVLLEPNATCWAIYYTNLNGGSGAWVLVT